MTLFPLKAKWMLYFVFFYLGWIPAFAGIELQGLLLAQLPELFFKVDQMQIIIQTRAFDCLMSAQNQSKTAVMD